MTHKTDTDTLAAIAANFEELRRQSDAMRAWLDVDTMSQDECVSALSTPIGTALVKWLASRPSDGVIVGPGFSGLACACRGSAADAPAAEAALRAGVLVRYSTRSAYGGGLWTWLGRGDDLTIRFDREVLRDPSLRLGDYGEQWVEEMTGHKPETPDLGTPPPPR